MKIWPKKGGLPNLLSVWHSLVNQTTLELKIPEEITPKYHCAKHGDIVEVLVSTLDGEEHAFCIRCWWEFLSQHLQKVERIEEDREP